MVVVALLLVGASIPNAPRLRSESVVVRFADTGEVLVEKNADVVRPIASVTKLLSGLVVSETPPDDALVTIGQEDKDRLKWSKSRLFVGFTAGARTLFSAALAASENRAMYAVVRALGFTREVFAEKMNALAVTLGMSHSRFCRSSRNRSPQRFNRQRSRSPARCGRGQPECSGGHAFAVARAFYAPPPPHHADQPRSARAIRELEFGHRQDWIHS